MHEITVHFGAIGEVPGNREKLMVQEREVRAMECCLSAKERKKSDLECQWGGQPQTGVRDSPSLGMGGKVGNTGPGAGRRWRHMQSFHIANIIFSEHVVGEGALEV